MRSIDSTKCVQRNPTLSVGVCWMCGEEVLTLLAELLRTATPQESGPTEWNSGEA